MSESVRLTIGQRLQKFRGSEFHFDQITELGLSDCATCETIKSRVLLAYYQSDDSFSRISHSGGFKTAGLADHPDPDMTLLIYNLWLVVRIVNTP